MWWLLQEDFQRNEKGPWRQGTWQSQRLLTGGLWFILGQSGTRLEAVGDIKMLRPDPRHQEGHPLPRSCTLLQRTAFR